MQLWLNYGYGENGKKKKNAMRDRKDEEGEASIGSGG